VRGRYSRRMPSRPTRRSVLAAALAVPAASAAGCTSSGPTPATRGSAREAPEVDPDVALLEQVSRATAAVVALYEAVVEEHRGLREDLRPLLAAHRAHEEALGEAAPPGDAQDRRRGLGSDASAKAPDVPGRPDRALERLVSAERDTSRRLLEATREAASGGFARLLASMSASSSQAVRVLGELSEGRA